MGRRVIAAAAAALALGGASTALAQDQGRVGLTMGYPTAVGLIVRVTDAVAVRPEFTLAQTSLETDVSANAAGLELNSSDSWSYGVGLGALFYLGGEDNLRPYVSPRFQYARTATDTTSPTSGSLPPLETEVRGSAFAVAVSFGAQYSPNRRFSVFGELGAAYSDSETTSTGVGFAIPIPITIRTTTSSTGWGVRSSVGVIWYF
jgi:hypothetical protein